MAKEAYIALPVAGINVECPDSMTAEQLAEMLSGMVFAIDTAMLPEANTSRYPGITLKLLAVSFGDIAPGCDVEPSDIAFEAIE